ncbi:MAG: hypothetical protein L3V56_05095 [Candidatus Magnetoovum sp. WYHC-5]|nr:hypothetical protein [Candidatus Magnetoovum sp. WYHC-5]
MLFKRLKDFISGNQTKADAIEQLQVEQLRILFKARYHSFQLLLNANNEVLILMSEIEEALTGKHPFNMSFITAKCTKLLVNVFSMVKHINELSTDKYKTLYDIFSQIQERIRQILENQQQTHSDKIVLPLSHVDMKTIDYVGPKMARLGEIKKNTSLLVPEGFVITSAAHTKFFAHNGLGEEVDRRIQAAEKDTVEALYQLCSNIQQLIINAELPVQIQDDILSAYDTLSQNGSKNFKICLRSSAIGEDSLHASFAGQYATKLNISREHILNTYKEIIASKYNITAMTYRINKGIVDGDVLMCVGCMEIVEASAGGVIYTADPIGIWHNTIIINAAWGLPKSVVDGTVEPDVFVLSKDTPITIIEQKINKKTAKIVCNTVEGLQQERLTDDIAEYPSLNDNELFELANIALRLENYYGTPQDIEWAISSDKNIYVLQCRPLKLISKDYSMNNLSIKKPPIIHGGVTASTGVAYGMVFNVKRHSDMLLFPQGAVLITRQALPVWATLMGQASAIITEEGSVLGHLANVAREFHVPTIFNLPKATTLFSNGQVITVDATSCKIYDGKVDELLNLNQKAEQEAFMKNTPVFNILNSIANEILPLTLINPSSSDFKQINCKTLHDITRYCHEKAVDEIFNFGKSHKFSERSSKKLICNSPLTWWVINLDDGFKKDVEGKYVHIENIISVPFLALWEGLNAFAWQGPPSLDAMGFLSIIFESTYNPALNPANMDSKSNNNYFLLSKNFCSLSSRLGYHLSTVEALAGERTGENYANFLFKGGAADYNRRTARTLFLAEILQDFGFKTQVKEDSLKARVEKEELPHMIKQLKLIGYLLMHSRQLDMIMNDKRSVEKYRAKFIKEMTSI